MVSFASNRERNHHHGRSFGWRHRAAVGAISILSAIAPIVSFAPVAAASTRPPDVLTLNAAPR